MRAILYVKSGCEFCDEMRQRLDSSQIGYEEIDVGDRREVIPELLKLTNGKRIVPVLVDADGIHVAPRGGSTF